jgi:hypothetical protein
MIQVMALVLAASVSSCLVPVVMPMPRIEYPSIGFGGSFELGKHSIDLSGVNSELERNNAGEFDDLNTTIGGSAYMIFGRRLLVGGEGAGFWQSTSGPDARAKIQGGYGFLDIGFVPVYTENFLVYPMLGIGGGGASLKFRSRTGSDFLFGDETLYEYEEPGFGTFAMNFSVGAEYRVKLFESRTSMGGLSLSMRTGYIWLPVEASWEVYDFEIFGAPEATFAGPYAKLGIGFWTSDRKRPLKF